MHIYVRMRLRPGVEYPQVERIESSVSDRGTIVRAIEFSPIREVRVTDSDYITSTEPSNDQEASTNLTWNDVVRAIHDGRFGISPKEYILRVMTCISQLAPNSGFRVLFIDEEGSGWEMTYLLPRELVGTLKHELKTQESGVRPTRFEREDVI